MTIAKRESDNMSDYVLRKTKSGFAIEFIGECKFATIVLRRGNDNEAIQLIAPDHTYVMKPQEAEILGRALIDIVRKHFK